MADQPDAQMMAAVERVAGFIGGGALAPDTFADGDVTIIENFAPFVFEGPGAVEAWAREMGSHLIGLQSLRHSFGPAIDFGQDGDRAYFSLPTTWRGVARGTAFTETGGWAFVLVKQGAEWRVRNYGWAVTSLIADKP